MMVRSHVMLGVAAWVVSAPPLHAGPFQPAYLALAVVGSLLPDLDHPQSWVGRRTWPLSAWFATLVGHRGITHSAVAVCGLVLLLLHSGYRRGAVSALAVGYLSHLVADMLTPQGLRLAWPLRRTWALPLCRTGSPMEAVVVFVLMCGAGWWVVRHGGRIAGRS